MERREQYDPEDIEALLMERPFHDLLPEERAFVLRHLSGQDEYESMRATLNAMRNLDDQRAPITADPAVRDNVMAAFRTQQQPQWRIWLNSVGALFVPKDGFTMWASLRIAGAAAIFGLGIWSVVRFNTMAPSELVAEVQHVEEPGKPLTVNEGVVTETEATPATDAIEDANGPQVVTNGLAATDKAVRAEDQQFRSSEKFRDAAFADAQPAPAVSGSGSLSNASEDVAAAEEESDFVVFDPRTAADSIGVVFKQDVEQAEGVQAASRQETVVREIAATRTKENKRKATTKTDDAAGAAKDNTSAMANSQALDQRLLSLQNAAW
ncbi:MAG: hypothetical protein IPO17_10220 [Flavobacteriales bacterium]|nr:hypothetical protein [Flavobacteriales bacterium]